MLLFRRLDSKEAQGVGVPVVGRLAMEVVGLGVADDGADESTAAFGHFLVEGENIFLSSALASEFWFWRPWNASAYAFVS